MTRQSALRLLLAAAATPLAGAIIRLPDAPVIDISDLDRIEVRNGRSTLVISREELWAGLFGEEKK